MLALRLKVRVETLELERLCGRPDPRAQEPALRANIANLAKEAALAVRPRTRQPALLRGSHCAVVIAAGRYIKPLHQRFDLELYKVNGHIVWDTCCRY